MSTFMAKKGSIERKWYVLDAAGKPLGKTAAAAANLLRGKLKPEYTPHTHSGWVGGLKEVKYRTLMQNRPELAMKLAVRGMMPRNVISRNSMTRLRIYRGGEHEHAAQKPEVWAL